MRPGFRLGCLGMETLLESRGIPPIWRDDTRCCREMADRRRYHSDKARVPCSLGLLSIRLPADPRLHMAHYTLHISNAIHVASQVVIGHRGVGAVYPLMPRHCGRIQSGRRRPPIDVGDDLAAFETLGTRESDGLEVTKSLPALSRLVKSRRALGSHPLSPVCTFLSISLSLSLPLPPLPCPGQVKRRRERYSRPHCTGEFYK